jgi:hypothetical protein
MTPCATGCCIRPIETPKPFPSHLFQPHIVNKTWVDFNCSPTGSSCGIKNYYFYIEGSLFSDGGNVRLEVWRKPHVFLGPAKLMGTMAAKGASIGISTKFMQYGQCMFGGYFLGIDEATGKTSNKIEADMTIAGYKGFACSQPDA